MEAEQPSDRIVEQRIRNRVIEYFEMVSSFAAQQAYEEMGPPFVNVPYEVINQWEDWIPNDPRDDINPLSAMLADRGLSFCGADRRQKCEHETSRLHRFRPID